MKRFKFLSVIVLAVISLCFAAVTASAASEVSSAQSYSSLTRVSLSAPSESGVSRTYRIVLPSSGRIKFYADKFAASDKSKYSILGSKGNELVTGKLISLKEKTLRFKGSGTYYLKISLAAGESMQNLLYTYTSDSAINETHSVAVEKNDSIDAQRYVRNFSSDYKWIVTNFRVSTIKNGQICALKAGSNTIEAFSTKGDHVKINVFVTDSASNGMKIQGANMIWIGDSFSYTYSYSDGKEYPDHEIVWSMSGNGSVSKTGKLSTLGKGDAVVTVTDKTSGQSASMTVHFIGSVSDVDFVPMINGIAIANKTYPVPASYAPGLDKEAKAAYDRMVADAAKQGLSFNIISSYRSYQKQVQTYNHWVSVYGKAEADRCSARPGFSEHQLGLAIDVNSCYTSFANTKEGKWLAKNCWKYGFILRYPTVESEKITGYIYEPWHIRYLGTDLAKTVYKSGLTLEEYLGIDSYYRQ